MNLKQLNTIGSGAYFPIQLEEVKDDIKKNSRRYAKRQFTFFNHQMPVVWFDVDFNNFSNTINKVIEYINNEEGENNAC